MTTKFLLWAAECMVTIYCNWESRRNCSFFGFWFSERGVKANRGVRDNAFSFGHLNWGTHGDIQSGDRCSSPWKNEWNSEKLSGWWGWLWVISIWEVVGVMGHPGRRRKRGLKTWNLEEHQHLRKWSRWGNNGILEAKGREFSRKKS